jgi:hypothetical protein
LFLMEDFYISVIENYIKISIIKGAVSQCVALGIKIQL